MSQELKFSSADEAIQHLSDITGKRVKIAVEEQWEDIDPRDDYEEEEKLMFAQIKPDHRYGFDNKELDDIESLANKLLGEYPPEGYDHYISGKEMELWGTKSALENFYYEFKKLDIPHRNITYSKKPKYMEF